jgi:hypothetical protein
VVSLISRSGGYINGRNSANLGLLIDKTSSIYQYVKLKALTSWIFLCFTTFWRYSDSDEYKNKDSGQFSTNIYDFKIIIFPNICSNIPVSPGVYFSQLIRYARASSNYSDFWRNSDSDEYKNKSTRRGAQLYPPDLEIKETTYTA